MAPQELGRRRHRRTLNTGGGKTGKDGDGGGGGGVKGEGRQAWQHEDGTPGERVAALLLSPRLSDLTISFPGGHNPIRAHRMVLAMHSPVLEASLYHGVGPGLQVLVSQDPPDAFMWMLRHMYRGPAPLPSLSLALQVALLARKYQVQALLRQCSQYLRENVTSSSVLSIYNVATTIKDLKLLQRCVKAVRECGASLLVSPSVGQLERPALAHLLKHLTQASHALVFRCIITWGQVRIASRGVDPHRSQLKEEVDEFLPRVSFLAMTTNEYVEHVMPSGVFSPEEDLAILLNMAGYKVNLPPPCLVGMKVEEDAKGSGRGGKGGGKGGGKESGGGEKKVVFTTFY